MLEQNSYKSPVRKLVNFFEKSRDNWKEKYQRNKKENNKLKNKVCALKASQEKWKSETLLLTHLRDSSLPNRGRTSYA